MDGHVTCGLDVWLERIPALLAVTRVRGTPYKAYIEVRYLTLHYPRVPENMPASPACELHEDKEA